MRTILSTQTSLRKAGEAFWDACLKEDNFTFKERCDIITPKARMEIRAHIFVSGRVQGVFFRDHTQRWASSLGLAGWVRNLYDGRVETVVEGEREKIEGLIAELKQGPPMADVTNVEFSWEDFKGEFDGFRITW